MIVTTEDCELERHPAQHSHPAPETTPASKEYLPNRMEKQSQNNGQRRRRNNRSGGGNRNRSNNRGGQNRNRNSNNRNRNRNRSGGGSRSRRAPRPTAWQKFLSTITFGWLGKPKSGGGKKKRTSRPGAQTSRPVRNNALKDTPAPEKKKRNRTEVTSGRLYVGNLSYETTEVELEELFRGIGNVVSAEVVTNARTQQSKGFAFVEMGSIDEAKRAVEVLDDEDFMGRKLIISGARSEGPRDGSDDSADEPEMAEAGADKEN